MAAAKPPVAIRITRPYQSEDEFLAREAETISRTGVTLVGAQPRPEGAVLRFEITLSNGTPLLRGEGRVVGFREGVQGGEGGLALRFTRLDSKSKALVDRVGTMRDAKRSVPPQSRPPGPPSQRPRGVPPPLPAAARRSSLPPSLPHSPPVPPLPPAPSETSIPEIPLSTSEVMVLPKPETPEAIPEPLPTPEPVSVSVPEPASVPEAVTAPDTSAHIPPSPDRDSALDRLRKRSLDRELVTRILEQGASRRR